MDRISPEPKKYIVENIIKCIYQKEKIVYDKETRDQALKLYYLEVSGRGVGKILGMNK